MSRYSFIDENINTSGKQCFCIDVNSKNSPFVNVSQANISTTNIPTSSPVEAPLQNIPKKIQTYEMIKPDQNYLLTPQVIDSSREKNMIETINSLMAQTYTNISSEKDFQASNAPTIDLPKTSLTVESKQEPKSQINLNTMANDTKVGKKTYRKSSSNLNLFEGFESNSGVGGCDNVCKPSNKSKYARVHSSKYKTKSKNNNTDNIYLVIIILAFLLCSWFKK